MHTWEAQVQRNTKSGGGGVATYVGGGGRGERDKKKEKKKTINPSRYIAPRELSLFAFFARLDLGGEQGEVHFSFSLPPSPLYQK